MKKSNPHDKFFKKIMSYPGNAEAFLSTFLSSEELEYIDLKTVEFVKDSFLSESLQESFSDLILKCKINNDDAYITIIVEHKSYKDEYVVFQILKYITDAYLNQISQIKKGGKLKPIIPILYYHGKSEWNYQHFDLFTKGIQSTFLEYLPQYKLIKIDLQSLDDSQILEGKNSYVKGMLMLQKYIFDRRKLIRNIEKIFSIFVENTKGNYLEPYMVYLFSSIKDDEFTKMLEVMETIEDSAVKNTFVSAYDSLIAKGRKDGLIKGEQIGLTKGEQIGLTKGEQIGLTKGEQIGLTKGEQIGLTKGEQIGINEKTEVVVIRSFENGLEMQTISKITEITEDEVRQILLRNGLIG